MQISDDAIGHIRTLYEAGLNLQAWGEAQRYGPLAQWQGSQARVMAGRLAMVLGDTRLGYALHLRAGRASDATAEARYFVARAIYARRGPLAAWRAMRRDTAMATAAPELRSDWLALQASVVARYRDFAAAEALLQQAETLCPDRPWIWVERTMLLEAQDLYDEALVVARRTLTHPSAPRAAASQAARLLMRLGRNAEAIELLTHVTQACEAGSLACQLVILLCEAEQYPAAANWLQTFVDRMPLLDKYGRQWVDARRMDIAYGQGFLAEAEAAARLVPGPYHERIVERLTDPNRSGAPVKLPVGYVQQHHMTCTPAALAAVTAYWGAPVDHATLAKDVSYDGTPGFRARIWLEKRGWLVRAFRLTEPIVERLIARGIPILMATYEATSSHMQAIVGYDSRLGRVIIRDPSTPELSEWLADKLLEDQRACGPQGWIVMPKERGALLQDLDLPEVELYDRLFALECALDQHQRATAASEVQTIIAAAGETHRIALEARHALASYDGDDAAILAVIDERLRLFPQTPFLLLQRLACLDALGRVEERRTALETLGRDKTLPPVFHQRLADFLSLNAQHTDEARALIARVLKWTPVDAPALRTRARLLWSDEERGEALQLYRFSACLDGYDENAARTYFRAARTCGHSEDGLSFLHARVRRLGSLSSWPVRSLFDSLAEIDRVDEAFAVLNAALAMRPDDGALRLYAAEVMAKRGRFAEAEGHLVHAASRSREGDLLRTRGLLAQFRGDLSAALAAWRAVLQAEPLAMDAHRQTAWLLARTHDTKAAIAHLKGVLQRFPHHHPMTCLMIEWTREADPAECEAALRQAIALHPADAWAHREFALLLADRGDFEPALREVALAGQIDPHSAAHFGVRGYILSLAGRSQEAATALRAALQSDVDHLSALNELVSLAEGEAAKREALAFVLAQMKSQPTCGTAVLVFRSRARAVYSNDELLQTLMELHNLLPDLWQAWVALCAEHADQGRLEEAGAIALRARERFPWLSAVWMERARIAALRGEINEQCASLDEAARLDPEQTGPWMQLAQVRRDAGDLSGARTALEAATMRDPADAYARGTLADVLRALGDKEGARTQVTRAIRTLPNYEWGLGALARWGKEDGDGTAAERLVRELIAERPADPQVWLGLAHVLAATERVDERLAALDEAIRLQPRLIEAHDLRADALSAAGRYDEALLACRGEAWGGRPPLALQGQAACILMARGERASAITRMREVLAKHTDYLWGANQLAGWLRVDGTNQEYLAAAETLVRLAPRRALSYGTRAAARQRLNDVAGARADLARAQQLEADYLFAGFRLFDWQTEDGLQGEARRTFERMRPHLSTAWIPACEIVMHAARGDVARSRIELVRLLNAAGELAEPLRRAVRAMHRAFGFTCIESAIEAQWPGIRPETGAIIAGVLRR